MTQPARLRALRLVGFKSFAERTVVEFGPGISAVVGPNGSGKSNLADALRWTLGEQGRLLRTRRSEDVIFAGSSSRRAIGMADVTLVIDNADRLLPLDYGEVEIGRRLYRSGESEYLLNRQRIRLRDLGELLDAANLADNAFLFIGQGMVDQALALRPEERRPLFEEAAGVRRHERRRRHAEAELAEAESNLERVHDVLAELRPQVRRLAAQAEQLEARRNAGLELAEALVAAARSRWIESWRAAQAEQQALDDAHARSDAEMAALREAEQSAERHSRMLAERAERERRLRAGMDQRRSETVELRLAQARLQSDIEARRRDEARLRDERAAVERSMVEARQRLAQPPPAEDLPARRRVELAEQELAEIERELAAAAAGSPEAERRPRQVQREALATDLRRQEERQQQLAVTLGAGRTRSAELARTQADEAARRDEQVRRLEAAAATEAEAESVAQSARSAVQQATTRRLEADRELAEAERELASARTRLAALAAALEHADDARLRETVERLGGRLLSDGLEVDPALRRAVSAALGEGLRALAVSESALGSVGEAGGVLLINEPVTGGRSRTADAAATAIVNAAVALGGDRLAAGVRRDPQGHVTRLLTRCVWVPKLADALTLRPTLGPGWRAATTAGEVVTDEGLVTLADTETLLDRRAAHEEQARRVEDLERRLAAARAAAGEATEAEAIADRAWSAARDRLDAARRERGAAEEAERSAQRRAETALREQTWAAAQLERGEAEAEALAVEIEVSRARLAELSEEPADGRADTRQAELRGRRSDALSRRERLAGDVARAEQRRQQADEDRRRAEIALAMAEPRSREIDAQLERLASRAQEDATRSERLAADLAAATERERRAAAELELLLGEGEQDRHQLRAAERAATEARERLRRAEARSRTAEVAVMEARLHLEQVREQLLVELAAIGPDGLRALRQAAGAESEVGGEVTADALGGALESALEQAVDRWATSDDEPAAAPGAGRLGALRRRFHELGAGNPFAAEEYAEVRQRLETLESQREDLEAAIAGTRRLIADLSSLIADQFLSTFAALEGAFARRFEQLFGGGEAQLSLTVPDDLSATGVEITARPPGKKRQPLAMLSGGERALTAVALLLAMLEVRPVPFCVLDEVDAALDESNIGRFSAALRGLADRIQFVVITHNRGTIEAADALYGVTIGDDAVSRIVSLRLPPADGEEERQDRQTATARVGARVLAEVPIVPMSEPAEAGGS